LARDLLIDEIVEKYRPVWALGHSMAVLRWDMETQMPDTGVSSRGMALGELSMMAQRATLGLEELVERAERARDVDDRERGYSECSEGACTTTRRSRQHS